MRDAPCGRADCPIVEPESVDRRSLRVVLMPGGSERWRVARTEFGRIAFTPPRTGNGRFSPVGELGHSYVAEQRTAALLESVLHEVSGPNPRIYAASLAAASMYRVRARDDLTLVDLRDGALADLGIGRHQLTGADPMHYRCTQRVAERLVGSKRSVGFVWTSRQGFLHAERNPDGLASEVLRHDSLDVAVLYASGGSRPPADVVGEPIALVDDSGRPTRFVLELANLLRIAIL